MYLLFSHKLIEPVSVHEDINPDLEGEVTSFFPERLVNRVFFLFFFFAFLFFFCFLPFCRGKYLLGLGWAEVEKCYIMNFIITSPPTEYLVGICLLYQIFYFA